MRSGVSCPFDFFEKTTRCQALAEQQKALMADPKAPSTPTVKRLFALSRNECAFPKCVTPLVDEGGGKVTGRICHIRAARESGPRYDAEQTPQERHSFDNLLLLCGLHHDVIDADTDAYTVDRLRRMKHDHEEASDAELEPSEETVRDLIATVRDSTVIDGSIIISQNQLGGQVAHSITNIGSPDRSLSEEAGRAITEGLLRSAPHTYEIEVNAGDVEAKKLAFQIQEVLDTANWSCRAFATSLFPQPILGLTVSYPEKTESVEKLIVACRQSGLDPKEALLPDLDYVHILVGWNEA